MASYVYTIATGALYSYNPDDASPVASPSVLAAKGLAVLTGQPALDATHSWQASPPAVIATPAAPAPALILTSVWILRFTPAEFAAITASTDPQVLQWLYSLNHTTQIDLSMPTFTVGVPYLVSIGLLPAARHSAILAAPASIDGP